MSTSGPAPTAGEWPDGWMPMFPLGTVLLPGAVLPLHVFEPRYRHMLEVCRAGTGEFGVALITRGRETGGGDERADVGTVARIVDSHDFPDGRSAHVTVGVRRCRVERWLPDDPYPQAIVSDWPDDGGVDRDAVDALAARVRSVLALASELGVGSGPQSTGADPTDEMGISDEPVLASYHLCALAPIGAHDRQRLLAAPGPAARLELLAALLDDTEAAIRFRLGSER